LERKLTAILCADVYGYSRLMGEDEEATIRNLSAHRKTIDRLIEEYHGRFVNSAGDSVLAEFASAVNAVECAVEIQTALKAENADVPPGRRMELRIGVNLGDVVVVGGELYGDGVNVAARLENLAEPGSIYISASIHEQISNKLALGYEDLGERTVKNIAKPVRVFRVVTEAGAAAAVRKKTRQVARNYWRGSAFSLLGLALIAGIIALVRHLPSRPPTTTASTSAQKAALILPGVPSIVVLPFANMSGDREQEYFSDGITDDLTTALSKSPDLFVIARTSAFTYKGKVVKVQDVSRQLGVKYVLEGSVRKADSQVRITAQLVEATTGDHLWAEHYDRPLKDIFSLQDEIVRKIATTLNLQLNLTENKVRAVKRTDNPEAYDYYLRGLEFLRNPTKEGNQNARRMYERAIELDPRYSDAYALLGYVQFLDMASQWSRDPHGFERAIQLEQKSIALDNSNAGAYGFLSTCYTVLRQFDLAVSAAERAIALGPNLAWAYGALAYALAYSKPAEALVAAQKAMRLDPLMGDVYALPEGIAYTVMGRYDQAIPPLKRYLAYINNVPARLYLIACYVELGRNQEAHAEAAEVMRISPQFSLALQKQISPMTRALRERLYDDMAKAGLK
jgi:adenylate cyclase